MRRTAYLMAAKEAKSLPTEIPGLKKYFKDDYSPKDAALQHIINKARKDDNILHGEFVGIYTKINGEV